MDDHAIAVAIAVPAFFAGFGLIIAILAARRRTRTPRRGKHHANKNA